MNSSNQQGNFQNQGQFNSQQQQSNAYKPLGYVQSHYQGIPSQQSSGGPVISHVGYTTGMQQGYGISSNQGNSQQQYAGYNNIAGNNPTDGPVISHVGYTAGQDFHQPQGYSNNYTSQPNTANYSQQPVISHLGYTAGQNFAPMNQNQGQYSQQQYGYGNAGGNNNMNMMNQNQFASNTHAVTPYNPVYQATNSTSQLGPVLSRVGYSTGNQQNGAGSYPQTAQTNMHQRF